MNHLSYYGELIVAAMKCKPEDAAEVEDVMRHTIFHSTLDWQTRKQFNKGAREAWTVVQAMRAQPQSKEGN